MTLIHSVVCSVSVIYGPVVEPKHQSLPSKSLAVFSAVALSGNVVTMKGR